MGPRVVIDTNVLVSALRSRRGRSYRILSIVDSGRSQPCVSVPLVLEYEAATKRLCRRGGLTTETVDTIIDYLCRVSTHCRIHYLWRPMLRDPNDDMVLEVAVAAQADCIVTHNRDDFAAAAGFGIRIVSPTQLLNQIGETL
jgi:putative PIN family toxin of toxin-antitoxin system